MKRYRKLNGLSIIIIKNDKMCDISGCEEIRQIKTELLNVKKENEELKHELNRIWGLLGSVWLKQAGVDNVQ